MKGRVKRQPGVCSAANRARAAVQLDGELHGKLQLQRKMGYVSRCVCRVTVLCAPCTVARSLRGAGLGAGWEGVWVRGYLVFGIIWVGGSAGEFHESHMREVRMVRLAGGWSSCLLLVLASCILYGMGLRPQEGHCKCEQRIM